MSIKSTIDNTEELSEHLKSQLNAMELVHPSDDFDNRMVGMIQQNFASSSSSRKIDNHRWAVKLLPAIAASILLVFMRSLKFLPVIILKRN